MQLHVIHKDAAGTTTITDLRVGLLQFLKAVGTAGDPDPRSITSILRGFGFFSFHWRYWEWGPLWDFELVRPEAKYSDPTQLGQFSNIVGKAIADYLARRISGAIQTHNYEAALAVRGIVYPRSRPDLYCDTGAQQFAVEAKGYSVDSVSENAMDGHKRQASGGPLPVHFSVASVAYNFFDRPCCKYYDPVEEGAEYERETNVLLAQLKYARILSILGAYPMTEAAVLGNYLVDRYYIGAGIDFPITFIVDQRIHAFVREGGEGVFTVDKISEEGVFLDNDGLGLELG